jgi:hypothetical protein
LDDVVELGVVQAIRFRAISYPRPLAHGWRRTTVEPSVQYIHGDMMADTQLVVSARKSLKFHEVAVQDREEIFHLFILNSQIGHCRSLLCLVESHGRCERHADHILDRYELLVFHELADGMLILDVLEEVRGSKSMTAMTAMGFSPKHVKTKEILSSAP